MRRTRGSGRKKEASSPGTRRLRPLEIPRLPHRKEHPLRRRKSEQLAYRRAVDADSGERHGLEVESASSEQPENGVRARVDLPLLDPCDRGLSHTGALRERPLGESCFSPGVSNEIQHIYTIS